MAKLSAHGIEIGRIELLTAVKAYMSDGTVLRNSGLGWKVFGKLKAGVTPEEAFARAQAKQQEFLQSKPAFRAYRAALHAAAPLSKRWKLHTAVELMPSDPDGVWSEACDGYADNVSACITEIVDLCNLYVAALDAQRTPLDC